MPVFLFHCSHGLHIQAALLYVLQWKHDVISIKMNKECNLSLLRTGFFIKVTGLKRTIETFVTFSDSIVAFSLESCWLECEITARRAVIGRKSASTIYQHSGDILSSNHQTTKAFTATVGALNVTVSLQNENYLLLQFERYRENKPERNGEMEI